MEHAFLLLLECTVVVNNRGIQLQTA